MADAEGEMTLVLTAGALARLTNPRAAVDEAGSWTAAVGVAAEGDVERRVERMGIDPDFVAGEEGVAGSLAAIRQRFPTDRHVLVGADEAERGTAQALGWEFLTVEEAAEKAGWLLG